MSNIQNNVGQFDIDEPIDLVEGELTHGQNHETGSAINPLNPQSFTFTITGAGPGGGAGDAEFDLVISGGRSGSDVLVEYTDAGDDDTDDQAAAGIAAGFDPADDAAALIGDISANANVVTVEFNPNSLTLDANVSVANQGTWSVAKAETTEGAAIPFGRFVVLSDGVSIGSQQVALPGAATTAPAIAGMAFRERFGIPNSDAEGSAAIESYKRGDVVGYVRKGRICGRVQGSTDAALNGQVYFGLSTAGVPGGVYADTAGGTAVLLPGCRFASSATAGNLALLDLNLPQ